MGNVMHVPSRFYPSCRYSIPHPAGRSYPAGGEQVQWWASSAFRQFFNCNTTQLYILHLQNINVTHVTFYNNSIFLCKTTHLGGKQQFCKNNNIPSATTTTTSATVQPVQKKKHTSSHRVRRGYGSSREGN